MDTAHLIWKDVQSIPENWKLINTLEIPRAINRPNYDIRIFKLLVEPIQKLKSQQYKYLKEMLMSKYSNIVNEKTRIYIVWECQRVDGTEELTLKDLQIKTAHIAFNPPQGVNFRIYDMLPNNENTDYQIIKEYGRGTVEIVQYPQRKNNYSMKIKIDDGPHPSYDYYRFYLVSYL